MTNFIEINEGTGKISIRGRVIRIRVGVPQIQYIKEAIMSSPKLGSETITFNLSEITRKLAESKKKPASKPINLFHITAEMTPPLSLRLSRGLTGAHPCNHT